MSNPNTHWKRIAFFPSTRGTAFVKTADSRWNDKASAIPINAVWDVPSGSPDGDVSLFAPSRSVRKPESYYCLGAQIKTPPIGNFSPDTKSFSSLYGGVRAGTESFVINPPDLGGGILESVSTAFLTWIYNPDGSLFSAPKPGFEVHGISSPNGIPQNDGKTRPYFKLSLGPQVRLDPGCYIVIEAGVVFSYFVSGDFDSSSAILGFGDSHGGNSSNEFNLYKALSTNDPPPARNAGFEFFGSASSGSGWQITES